VEAHLTDTVATLRPAQRTLILLVSGLMVAGWAASGVTILNEWLHGGFAADPKLPWILLAVKLLGFCVLSPMLLWGMFGYTSLQLDDQSLIKARWIRSTRIGRARVFERERVEHLRLTQHTRSTKHGPVSRYAIEFEYKGRTVRLITDPTRGRLQAVLFGVLRPLVKS
jgi:hypothetical protein